MIVTEADIQPHSWVCEGCRQPFKPGDVAIPQTIDGEYGHDPYGLRSLSMGGTESDYDLTSGHTESDWRCTSCVVSS